jgi:hypothetical protein
MRRELDRDYVLCARCDEYDDAALSIIHRVPLCRNCQSTRATMRICSICARWAPSERHHIASKRQMPTLTLPVCLNCHAILSQMQTRWDPRWKTESRPLWFLLEGLCDVLVLWLERRATDTFEPELVHLLGEADLYLQAVLRTRTMTSEKVMTI